MIKRNISQTIIIRSIFDEEHAAITDIDLNNSSVEEQF